MTRYATGTSVSINQTQMEIKSLLLKYGASGFMLAENDEGHAVVGFQFNNRMYRINVVLPDIMDPDIGFSPKGKQRPPVQAEKAWKQACRSVWRAVRMYIYAKLEAVEIGITSLEEAFLADTMLSDGKRLAERAVPALEQEYATGKPVALLPGGFGD